MTNVIPFVTIKNCLEAIDFYKEVFNASVSGEITMLNQIEGYKDKKFDNMVGHATLVIGETTLFLGDDIKDGSVKQGNNIQFVLNLEDEESLRSKFYKIAEQGELIEDLHEVFWGALFGTVKDKYGIYWQLYYGHK